MFHTHELQNMVPQPRQFQSCRKQCHRENVLTLLFVSLRHGKDEVDEALRLRAEKALAEYAALHAKILDPADRSVKKKFLVLQVRYLRCSCCQLSLRHSVYSK